MGALFRGTEPAEVREQICYFEEIHDVCVDPRSDLSVLTFQQVAREMKRLGADGSKIAVISNHDTNLYAAANLAPWGRYSPLLPNLMTVQQVEHVRQELAHKMADYVFLPSRTPHRNLRHKVRLEMNTTDAWQRIGDTVRSNYRFDHKTGPFDVWRAR